MESSESSTCPEADISAILKSYGIEPCKDAYEAIDADKKPFFLLSRGRCVSYETRDLGTARGKTCATNFKAIVVNEDKEEKGAGIYYADIGAFLYIHYTEALSF